MVVNTDFAYAYNSFCESKGSLYLRLAERIDGITIPITGWRKPTKITCVADGGYLLLGTKTLLRHSFPHGAAVQVTALGHPRRIKVGYSLVAKVKPFYAGTVIVVITACLSLDDAMELVS